MKTQTPTQVPRPNNITLFQFGINVKVNENENA